MISNMKKFFVFFLAAIILSSLAVSQENDIRNLKWGMSFEKVQQIEGLKSEFYKEEEIFGIKVEILFGCDLNGLYFVSYSTQDKTFFDEISKVLVKKYGEPKSDLDYSFLLKSKDILKRNAEITILVYEKGDFSKLDANTEIPINEKRIMRAGLSKRSIWEYGNTAALLLNNVDGIVLSYWPKTYHYDSKKKFNDFMIELKKIAAENETKKKTEEIEKF